MADVLVSTSTWQGASYEVDHAAVRHLVVERMLATGDELRDIARNAGYQPDEPMALSEGPAVLAADRLPSP